MYVCSSNAAVMLEEKVTGDVSSQDIQVYWICAIFSATLRFVCSIQHMRLYSPTRPSGYNTFYCCVVSNVLKVGRVEETKVEKWEEESLPSL